MTAADLARRARAAGRPIQPKLGEGWHLFRARRHQHAMRRCPTSEKVSRCPLYEAGCPISPNPMGAKPRYA